MGQEVTKYPHATFSWIDLSTTDAEGAKAFYTQLFGWEADDQPLPQGGVYTMLTQNGKNVAGLQQQQQEGMPTYWSSYINVDDVDAITKEAEASGATVVAPPFDVMDSGRMSVISDPTGAMVGLWQAGNHIGAQLVNIPNALCWNELYTRDLEAANKFYTSVFGWESSVDPSGYHFFTNNGRGAGGMMEIEEAWGDVPPYWNVYIAVDDCQATVDKAKELGATVVMGPHEAAEVGTFAMLIDPQGGGFTVIKMNQADPMP